jgi:uncharacterized protein YndB with AHSA1/START domain
MTVKVEKSGRRSIQVEVEVPGIPEQVWQAIASGPGISAWFVPTKFESGKDDKPESVTHSFGPGMDSDAQITAWEPNKRFAAESPGWAPGMPSMATEWTVEARSGGTCTVRVVHSLFASTDDWDDQLTSVESGWPMFFAVLKTYLAHFRGEKSGHVYVMGGATGTRSEVWTKLLASLGLGKASAGQAVTTSVTDESALSGTVETVSSSGKERLIMRLNQPLPGMAIVLLQDCGGFFMVSLSLYLYGPTAPSVAERERQSWQKWMETNCPMAANASPGA